MPPKSKTKSKSKPKSKPKVVKVAVVYTLVGCPWCAKVKKHLRGLKYKITERKISHGDRQIKMINGKYPMSYPQVFIKGRLIGGCDATIKKIKK